MSKIRSTWPETADRWVRADGLVAQDSEEDDEEEDDEQEPDDPEEEDYSDGYSE
jgi:hypothetical protein